VSDPARGVVTASRPARAFASLCKVGGLVDR